MARAKPLKVTRLVTDPALPDGAQAASLALGLCRAAKVDTFADLEAKIAEGDDKTIQVMRSIRLSPQQVELIEQNMYAVRAIATTPLRSVAVCDTCESVLVVRGGAPKKCTLTRGCAGQAHRATAASRREDTAET